MRRIEELLWLEQWRGRAAVSEADVRSRDEIMAALTGPGRTWVLVPSDKQ